MKNKAKALKAIEYLTCDDFAVNLEWNLYDGGIKDPNLKRAAELISQIYKISHAEGKCTGHPEWEDEKYKVLKNYKDL